MTVGGKHCFLESIVRHKTFHPVLIAFIQSPETTSMDPSSTNEFFGRLFISGMFAVPFYATKSVDSTDDYNEGGIGRLRPSLEKRDFLSSLSPAPTY